MLLLKSKYRVVYLTGATIPRCPFQRNLNQIPLKQFLNKQPPKALKLLVHDGATALVDGAEQLTPSTWTYASCLSLMISFPVNWKDMDLINGSLGG